MTSIYMSLKERREKCPREFIHKLGADTRWINPSNTQLRLSNALPRNMMRTDVTKTEEGAARVATGSLTCLARCWWNDSPRWVNAKNFKACIITGASLHYVKLIRSKSHGYETQDWWRQCILAWEMQRGSVRTRAYVRDDSPIIRNKAIFRAGKDKAFRHFARG